MSLAILTQVRRLPLTTTIPALVVMAATPVLFSDAGSDIFAFVGMFYGGIALGLWWLIRFTIHLLRRKRSAIAAEPRNNAILRWSIEPLALGIAMLSIVTGLFFLVRFTLSYPSLSRYVHAVQMNPSGKYAPGVISHSDKRHFVGLFHVKETELLSGGGVRMITASSFLDDAGIAYIPVGEPPRIGEDYYHHLYGAWYHWERSW